MKKERLYFLFHLYIEQKCTRDEEIELMQLLIDSSNEEDRGKLIRKCYDNLPDINLLDDVDADRIFQLIVDKPVEKMELSFVKNNRTLIWFSTAAAVVLLFIAITAVMFRNNRQINEINQIVEIVKPINKPLYKNDIKSGGNKAILTLADGSKIVLDDASEGTLSKQGNTTIIKLGSGRLAYNLHAIPKIPSKEIFYNTLTTPPGGKYCVALPDGTIVWLNASTSLKFPTVFAGNERKVEIKGEAYFEVAKNKAMPFIVKALNSEIKVLGTHFNVMAYADDKVQTTTLLEGSVEVKVVKNAGKGNEDSVIKLRPGQQAQLDDSNTLTVVDVDADEAIAWKNGFFIFNNEDIESIMHKISRWYDVKVVFEGNASTTRYTGNISRSENVSEILRVLELTESIHFKIEGKTITVLP